MLRVSAILSVLCLRYCPIRGFASLPTHTSFLDTLHPLQTAPPPVAPHSRQEPHGGTLVNNMITDDAIKASEIASCDFSIELSDRQLCDVELLMQVSSTRYLTP